MAKKNCTHKIRLVLADDHPVVRSGIRKCLESTGRFVIVGEASTGSEAIQLARQVAPDVVLLDLNMPELDGLKVTEQLSKLAPRAKVLILSVEDSEQSIKRVLSSGAKGYLLKDTPPEELLRAIEAVISGQTYFGQSVVRALNKTRPPQGAQSGAGASVHLTTREIQVLRLIADGHTNKQIAAKLGISVRTVEAHRENLMRKLNIHNAAGLTRYAIAHRIVPLE